MSKQAHVGPVWMPFEKDHPSEVLVFMFAGLLGAIIGATIINHYRHKVEKR